MVNIERDYYQELGEFRTWAAAVRERLGQLSLSANPVARTELATAVKLADELYERADEPISIGLVGEFSVGKSRLLNALLKLPGLLPVSAPPTTGNITALRIRAAQPGQRPGLLAASVSYMSRPELSKVAGFMLGELKSVINRDRLQYDVSSLWDYDPVTGGWEKFEDLAWTWWERDHGTNLEVRLLAWELLRLRNAMLIGAELVPDRGTGWPIAINLDLVREAIEIGDSRDLPHRFPERPSRRPIRAGAPLSAAALRDTFPLIRRLTYDVSIEPDLLRLNGLRDSNGLELLDFAGLHTAGAARDEFLCGRELERITGYLEVVKADHAETRTATRFASMLEGRRKSKAHLADSVMLVANMFDQVPPAAPSVTLSELGAASKEMGSLLRIAKGVSPQLRRVALTSAVVDHGDPAWAAVAGALHAWEPDSGEAQIAAALRAYAADGGLGRLRDMLSDHIGTVALPIIVAELTGLRSELLATLTRLRGLLAPRPAAANGEHDRKLLGDLVVELHRMIVELKAAAMSFRDAEDIAVAATDQRPAGVPGGLLERIRHDAVIAVYAWPVWNAVLSAFRDGEIRAPTDLVGAAGESVSTGASGLDPGNDGSDDFERLMAEAAQTSRGDRDATSAVEFPLTTGDFEDFFKVALSALKLDAGELALRVVCEWVDGLHERHAALRQQMADPRIRSLLAERLAAQHPDGGAARLQLLGMIADLSWVPDLFETFLTAIEVRAAQAGANAYPLARGHALPWHTAYEKDINDEDLKVRRHHSRAHRLRHDLAEGLAFPVQTTVAMAFGSLEAELEGRLDMLQGQVPNQTTLLAAHASTANGGPEGDQVAALLDDLLRGPDADTDEGER